MMISERHIRIVEELKNDPEISVKALSEKLFVSEPTVRRDLTELHNKGIINKTILETEEIKQKLNTHTSPTEKE